jgi:hypothetical protein
MRKEQNHELFLNSIGLNNRHDMSKVTLMNMQFSKISPMCKCEYLETFEEKKNLLSDNLTRSNYYSRV